MLDGFWKVFLYFIIAMGGVVGLAALFAVTMDLGNAIDDLKQEIYELRYTARTTVETWRDPENEHVITLLSNKEKETDKVPFNILDIMCVMVIHYFCHCNNGC